MKTMVSFTLAKLNKKTQKISALMKTKSLIGLAPVLTNVKKSLKC